MTVSSSVKCSSSMTARRPAEGAGGGSHADVAVRPADGLVGGERLAVVLHLRVVRERGHDPFEVVVVLGGVVGADELAAAFAFLVVDGHGHSFSLSKQRARRFDRAFGDVLEQPAVVARAAEHADRDRRGEEHRDERFEVEIGVRFRLRFAESGAEEGLHRAKRGLQLLARVGGKRMRLRDRVQNQTAAPLRVAHGEADDGLENVPCAFDSFLLARERRGELRDVAFRRRAEHLFLAAVGGVQAAAQQSGRRA